MFPVSHCLAIMIAVATVIANNLHDKKKNPLDFE